MKKFTESLNNITKVKSKKLVYFDLFPLLKGLESERPGIKDRVWKWMCKEWDVAFKPYNGRIININLYYYGIGDEYPLKDLEGSDGSEIEHSKKIHPEAFQDYMGPGKGDKEAIELRKDLNLIWSVYEDEIEDPEAFSVITQW